MSVAVETATKWVRAMVQRESKSPGDTVNAMRRLSRRYSVPYSLLWSLKYRPPKDLYVSAYEKLQRAYESEIQRGINSLRQERAITQAKTWLGKNLSRAASALVREED
jgi:hypothetical protein